MPPKGATKRRVKTKKPSVGTLTSNSIPVSKSTCGYHVRTILNRNNKFQIFKHNPSIKRIKDKSETKPVTNL